MKNRFIYNSLDKILRRLVRKKRWRLAHLLLNLSGNSFGTSGWLDKHIRYCSGTIKEYRSYTRPDMISSRLSAFGYTHISSKPVYAGLVNIGAMIHYVVNNRTNKSERLFEKVYHQSHSQSAEHEELLFDQIDTESVAAPGFKGKFNYGPFISLLYNYIESNPLTQKDKEICKYELVIKLWGSKPTKKIIDNSHNIDHVDLLLNKESVHRMLEASNSDLDRIVVEFMQVNAKRIIREFQNLPRIIVHKDLNYVNIIKSNDGIFYLVDWDKWCISNVGAGLLIKTDELFNPVFIRYLSSFNRKSNHLSPLGILKNVCIYNLTYNLRYKNYQNALNWSFIYYSLKDQ